MKTKTLLMTFFPLTTNTPTNDEYGQNNKQYFHSVPYKVQLT